VEGPDGSRGRGKQQPLDTALVTTTSHPSLGNLPTADSLPLLITADDTNFSAGDLAPASFVPVTLTASQIRLGTFTGQFFLFHHCIFRL